MLVNVAWCAPDRLLQIIPEPRRIDRRAVRGEVGSHGGLDRREKPVATTVIANSPTERFVTAAEADALRFRAAAVFACAARLGDHRRRDRVAVAAPQPG